MTILVKDALVYMGDGLVKNDVLIKNSLIDAIGTSISANGVDRVFNAQDKFLIPGFVDVHVHLREPGFLIRKRLKAVPQPLQEPVTPQCARCRILILFPTVLKILRLKRILLIRMPLSMSTPLRQSQRAEKAEENLSILPHLPIRLLAFRMTVRVFKPLIV